MSRGFLGTSATLVADINLVVQIIMWVLLVFGVIQARLHNDRVHARLSLGVVALGIVLFATVMDPAFFRVLPFIWQNPGLPRPFALWLHAAFGTVAQILGIYIVIRMQWGKALDVARTPRFRWLMRVCAVLWTAALAAGALLYYLRYV